MTLPMIPHPHPRRGTCRRAAAQALRLARPLLVATLAAASLSACIPVPLLIGGAAMGGTAVVVSDRRTPGAQLEDQSIEMKGNAKVRELLGEAGHVNITSYNRSVLLTGEVPTEADFNRLEQAISRIDNVRATVNELAIAGVSSGSSRSNDTVLTTKVKATLIDARDVPASAFKVVTERGIVYLLGRVSEREAKRAVELTRGIPGVLKVVRVLEIVSEADLAASRK